MIWKQFFFLALLLQALCSTAEEALFFDKAWALRLEAIDSAYVFFDFGSPPLGDKYQNKPYNVRAIRVYGLMPYEMADKSVGSAAYEEHTRGWDELKKKYDTPVNHGHLLAYSLGGSGLDSRNIIAQTEHSNLQQERIERAVRDFIHEYRCTVKFDIQAIYEKGKEYASGVFYKIELIDMNTVSPDMSEVKTYPWFTAEIENDARSRYRILKYIPPFNNMRKSCERYGGDGRGVIYDMVADLTKPSRLLSMYSDSRPGYYGDMPSTGHTLDAGYEQHNSIPHYGTIANYNRFQQYSHFSGPTGVGRYNPYSQFLADQQRKANQYYV